MQYSKRTKIRTKINNTKQSRITIFSYNISWESMTGSKPEWELCSNNTDSTHPQHYSVCRSNITQVIEENIADFVLLQEASNYKSLIMESSNLAGMNYEYHISGKDEMVSFWNKKYHKLICIKGQFEEGRPWIAILFSNGLCLINIHMGHYTNEQEINMLDNMLSTVLNKLSKYVKNNIKNKSINKSINKSKTRKNLGKHKALNYIKRIVIGGDFNNDIKKISRNGILKIAHLQFHHNPKHVRTCCIHRNTHFDHVIDTQQAPLDIIIPNVHHMASDHKPILVKIAN
jgi:endonuclease/exonuclease/phosphatase family metal-dependent hydrolase